MNKIILFLLLNFVAFLVKAQDEYAVQKRRLGLSVLSAYAICNFNQLNEELEKIGFPKLKNENFVSGIAFNIGNISNKNFLDIQILSFSAAESSATNMDIMMSGFGLYTNYNHNLLRSEKFFLHPSVGIGFSMASMRLVDSNLPNSSFGSAISNLSKQKDLVAEPVLVLAGGLGFDYKFHIFNPGRDWYIGLRADYHHQFSAPAWFENGYELSDSPDVFTGGFSAGLAISFFL